MLTLQRNGPRRGRRSLSASVLGTWRRRVATLLVVASVSLAATCRTHVIVEVPQCADTPDELFDTPLPPDWEEWYLETYDPFCEALRNADNP